MVSFVAGECAKWAWTRTLLHALLWHELTAHINTARSQRNLLQIIRQTRREPASREVHERQLKFTSLLETVPSFLLAPEK
jgi:hypothetical protein